MEDNQSHWRKDEWQSKELLSGSSVCNDQMWTLNCYVYCAWENKKNIKNLVHNILKSERANLKKN